MDPRSKFREIWACDFEFAAQTGEQPSPVCLVAQELRSRRVVRLWRDDLLRLKKAPFSTGPKSLCVAFYASAELGCFKVLGWDPPTRVLDLYPEFKSLTSGLKTPCGHGLLGALVYFGIPGLGSAVKDSMRQLVLRGGEYSPNERKTILDYCQSDVDALAKLLPEMIPTLDLPRALLRGRYMTAVAAMEFRGVPIDISALTRIRNGWQSVKQSLIEKIDAQYGIYQSGTFRADRFDAWLRSEGIAWPRTPRGDLTLDDDTFREMARSWPAVAPIRELRHALSQMRLNELAVGHDGRNRCLLSPFGSKTSRNQPSNSKFIFGPSVWLRSLIRPVPGMALAYVDWCQQELGIAAALSGDQNMQHAYRSGDFYLTFAQMANAVPKGASKATHRAVREQFKVLALGVQYGMSEWGLARKLDISPAHGRELLARHRLAFPGFWKWSDAVQDESMLTGQLQTVFGWKMHTGDEPNPRSLRNFPMQANGAEMMRLACCLAVERGVGVCCPVHDALLIEAPIEGIDRAVEETRAAMAEASDLVLDGFVLRTDAKIVCYPDRFFDERGRLMWEAVSEHCGISPTKGCRNRRIKS